MRANDRCEMHVQGDRCRKPKGHNSPLALNPDPVHQGDNLKFYETPQGPMVEPLHPRTSPRRNRQLNRFVDSLLTFNPKAVEQKQVEPFLGFLTAAVKYLRRSQ